MEASAVTVGVFDGVHRGHKAILDLLIGEARRRGIGTAAVTFDPHPDKVVRSRPVPLLTTIDERVELLTRCGVDQVRVLRFDGALRDTPHEVFVRDVLVKEVGCKLLVVGPSFAIGKGRAGTAQALRYLGGRLGFGFLQADPVMEENRPVSSTWVREAVVAGRMELAAQLLGRPYMLRGEVVSGAGRGREIGFPTANLDLPPDKLPPGPGTYAGAVHAREQTRPAAVNIGFRPTFRESPSRGLTIEAHILDFKADLAGERIELLVVARLRDERHFGDKTSLARQIAKDVAEARKIVGPEYLVRESRFWQGC